MASSNKMTDFQCVIKDIENYKYTEDEKLFIDEHFGPPLTKRQKYGMHLRHHLHLAEDEIGEGLNVRLNKSLPKSFNCLYDETTDLNKLWKIYCRLIWWKHLHNYTIEESWWDYGERLLKRGAKTRKTHPIDYVASVMERRIIYDYIDE